MKTIALAIALGLAGCADVAICGNAILEAGEGCDDANALGGDGCSAGCLREDEPAFADEVIDAPNASGSGFGDPMRAINGVRGGGESMQSLDVYSIGIGPDEWLVLAFAGRRLVDGPGDDLAVFENAFVYSDGLTFIDAAIVEVSSDGSEWVALAYDYVAPDERVYSARAEHWMGFAGVTPVYLHAEDAPLDPFAQEAGGDRFDLAELAPSEATDRIRREGARFVRILAAASRVNDDTGEAFVIDPVSDGPDIDGIYARYLVEEP